MEGESEDIAGSNKGSYGAGSEIDSRGKGSFIYYVKILQLI